MPLFDQPVVASLGRNLPAEELPGLPDREVTDIDDLLDLAASLAQDLAVLEADEPCQVLFSCAKTIAEPAHDLATMRGRHQPPPRERLVRLCHGAPAVVRARGSNMRQDLARGRVARLDRCSRGVIVERASVGDARDRRARLHAEGAENLIDSDFSIGCDLGAHH